MSLSFSRAILLGALVLAPACGRMEQSSRSRPGDGAIIYQSTVLTMDPRRPFAEAVIVKDGSVLDLGSIDDLVQAYPGAAFDERFLRRTLLPAFVDVRVPPNSLKVLEIPCQGTLLAEDVLSAGADGAPVRVVASGGAAFAAVTEALRRIEEGAAIGRVSVEARGLIDAGAARRLIALDFPMILTPNPVAEDCDPLVPQTDTPAIAGAAISGRIAIAPATGGDQFLAAAGAHLGETSALKLSPQEALEALTSDAAFALGDEAMRGVIAPGRRAEFTVFDRNPLATPGEAWGAIRVEAFAG